METNRVRQFLALAETRNLRKAAELMKLSHSAFHKSLQVLQTELGYSVYALEGRCIVITPEGWDFYERAKLFLAAERALLDQPRKKGTIFKVATNETFASYLVSPFWKLYFDKTPLLLQEFSPGKLEEAVDLGIVNVGLTHAAAPRASLNYIRMGKIRSGIYARKGVFPTKPGTDLPFVISGLALETISSGTEGMDGWPNNRLPRRIFFRTDLLSSALNLVAEGLCAIFIPHFVARTFNFNRLPSHQFVLLEAPKKLKPVSRDIYLVTRKGASETKELRCLARLVRTEAV